MLLYGHRRTHAKSLLIIVCKVMEVLFVISVNCLYTWIFYNPNWWVQSNENNQKTWRKPKQKLILKTDCFNERCKIVFQQHGKKSTLLMIPGTTAEKSLHHSEQSQMHHCGTIILCTGIKLVFYAFCIHFRRPLTGGKSVIKRKTWSFSPVSSREQDFSYLIRSSFKEDKSLKYNNFKL